jgi:hypothetical protein
MQSRREIALNTAFLLRKASAGRVFINELEKSASRSVLYTINHLLKKNLLKESIERDAHDIPRVALSPTERGRALLKKMEKHDPVVVITV